MRTKKTDREKINGTNYEKERIVEGHT